MDTVRFNQEAIARSISHVPQPQYILKIQSFSLLAEIDEEKYESEGFEAGGYNWKLILYPNGNKSENVKDHISLYLSIANTSSLGFGWEVYAIFRLFLRDQKKDDKFLILQGSFWNCGLRIKDLQHLEACGRLLNISLDAMGKERRFHGLKSEWGFDRFIPLKAFKDALNGYLVQDTCVFGVEVFVKDKNMGKGECFSMIKYTTSFKHAWKIQNFSKLNRYYSEVFSGAEHKWKIGIYPKGGMRATGTHLSLFLGLIDPSFKLYAEYGNHKTRTGKVWFRAFFGGWGWSRFIELSYLDEPGNGYLVNDVCVVEAEVNLLGICKAF